VRFVTREAIAAMVERKSSRWWYLLLLLPLPGLLYPPLYSTKDPEIAGIPFFYWYQFAWVIASAILTAIVYRRTRRT
jgi:hypothetical protein